MHWDTEPPHTSASNAVHTQVDENLSIAIVHPIFIRQI